MLLTPYDFAHRSQYLHARATLQRLIELDVMPIVNENDTVADDGVRYGDNDRLAALVSHLVRAQLLLLLTDTAGLFTADPRVDAEASLIEEIIEVDEALERVAGGTGSERGSGGMASKLAAAKIAAWSGVRAVIASAAMPGVVTGALEGRAVGTAFPAARRGSRPASSGSHSDRARTVALSWTRVRGGRSSNGASHCSPRVFARSTGSSNPMPRSRSQATMAESSPRASRVTPPVNSARSRASARPSCPKDSRTRSCIGMISWSYRKVFVYRSLFPPPVK